MNHPQHKIPKLDNNPESSLKGSRSVRCNPADAPPRVKSAAFHLAKSEPDIHHPPNLTPNLSASTYNLQPGNIAPIKTCTSPEITKFLPANPQNQIQIQDRITSTIHSTGPIGSTRLLPRPNPPTSSTPPTEVYQTKICCNQVPNFKFSFLTLAILASHVGAVFSLFAALVMTYLGDGLDVRYRSVLNGLSLPFAITPVYGIIIDTRFIRAIGKSKTYVLVCPIIYSTILLGVSFYVEEWIRKLEIWAFFGCFLAIMLALSVFLTAMDGWISFLFSEQDKAKGSFSRVVGFASGAFICYNVFILGSSDKWCTKIGLEGKLFGVKPFIKVVAVYLFVSSMLIFCFVSEKVQINEKTQTISEILSAFRGMVKKPMARKWLIMCFLKTFGVDGIMQVISTVLVAEGLEKEVLTWANTVSGIPILLGAIPIYKMLEKGKIYGTIYWILWLCVPLAGLDYYTYYDFKTNGEKNTLWFSIAAAVFGGWAKATMFTLETAQVAVMCGDKLASTHFATFQVILNVANALPFLLGSFIIGFVRFEFWC